MVLKMECKPAKHNTPLWYFQFRDKRFEASLDKKDHTETEEARDMMDIISDFRKEKDMDDVTLKDFFISIWTFYTAGKYKAQKAFALSFQQHS